MDFTLKQAKQKVSEIFANSKIQCKPQAIRDVMDKLYLQYEDELHRYKKLEKISKISNMKVMLEKIQAELDAKNIEIK